MKKMYTYIVAALLIVACSLWFYHANAKVCFLANEGDCGQNATGGDLDPYGNDGTDGKCVLWYADTRYSQVYGVGGIGAPNFIFTKTCIYPYNSEESCPYDSRWSICCHPKYNYKQKCVGKLVVDSDDLGGKCGSRYACKCSDDYPYYMGKNSSNEEGCTNGGGYFNKNAYVGGDSCEYTTYENGDFVTKSRYEKCECSRSLYPYKDSDECSTATHGISSPSGESCTSSDGTISYKSCTCSPIYEKFASDCHDGYDQSDYCMQDGRMKVKNCCHCSSSSYPYDENPEGKGAVKHADACDCGTRWVATECETGYKIENGRCTIGACHDALKVGLTGNDSYAVYNGEATVPSAQNIIVADDIEVANSAALNNKTVMSAAYFVKHYPNVIGSDMIETVVQKCPTTLIPTITFDRIDVNLGGYVDFRSVNLKGDIILITRGNFDCYNCAMDVDKITMGPNSVNTAKMYMHKQVGDPNDQNLNIKSQKLSIALDTAAGSSEFYSEGYSYDVGDFYIKNYEGNIIQIAGESSTRIRVIANKLQLEGIALFKSANIYPQKVLVGGRFEDGDKINCAKGGVSTAGNLSLEKFKESFLEIYNTDLYLLKNNYFGTIPAEVYMCAPSAIGYPWEDENGNTWKPGNLKRTGTRIISRQSVVNDSSGKRHYYEGFVYRTKIHNCKYVDLMCYDRHSYLKVRQGAGVGPFAPPEVISSTSTAGQGNEYFYYKNARFRDLPAFVGANGLPKSPKVSSVWKYAGDDNNNQVSCYNDDPDFDSSYEDECVGNESKNGLREDEGQQSEPIGDCVVVDGFYKCYGSGRI